MERALYSCILRRSCKSAFLHPEEEIQVLDRSATGLMSKMLSRLFPLTHKEQTDQFI
jgi:hypothetical protein